MSDEGMAEPTSNDDPAPPSWSVPQSISGPVDQPGLAVEPPWLDGQHESTAAPLAQRSWFVPGFLHTPPPPPDFGRPLPLARPLPLPPPGLRPIPQPGCTLYQPATLPVPYTYPDYSLAPKPNTLGYGYPQPRPGAPQVLRYRAQGSKVPFTTADDYGISWAMGEDDVQYYGYGMPGSQQQQPTFPIPPPPPVPISPASSVVSGPLDLSHLYAPSSTTHRLCRRCDQYCDKTTRSKTCHAERKYYHPASTLDHWVHPEPAVGKVYVGFKRKAEDNGKSGTEHEGRLGHGNQHRIVKVVALLFILSGGLFLLAQHVRELTKDELDRKAERVPVAISDIVRSSLGLPSSVMNTSSDPQPTQIDRRSWTKRSEGDPEVVSSSKATSDNETRSAIMLELLSDVSVTLGGTILVCVSILGLWHHYHSTPYICSYCLKPWSDNDEGCRWQWSCCRVLTESDKLQDSGCRASYRCEQCFKDVGEKGCESRCAACGMDTVKDGKDGGRKRCKPPIKHTF